MNGCSQSIAGKDVMGSFLLLSIALFAHILFFLALAFTFVSVEK